MNYVKVNNYSLKQHNTLRIDAKAGIMLYPINEKGVREIYKKYYNRKIIVLGNGSNILFSKKYYDENYVFLSFKLMDEIEIYDNEIYCQSGVKMTSLSWFALEHGVQGYEFLEDVPGSLGGAIIMNAGTYEDNIGDLIMELTYYNICADEILTEEVQKSDFGRRYSKWTNDNSIILSACLKAPQEHRLEDYEKIIDKLLMIKKQRYLKQPRNHPNAGSVFKRPSKGGKDYYIWKLFDELNLRGYRKNDAMISKKHPGFIVNVGNAEPEDVLHILSLAKEKVKINFNIDLELEWKIV